MSNYLAIATVTEVLQNLLQGVVSDAVPGTNVEVTVNRPEKTANGQSDKVGVNLYLYQVMPNPAWRNADLPTRNGAGQVVQRPQVALDLHYLLTFYGNESKMEPQRLLGKVVSVLHAQPLLTPAYIDQVVKVYKDTTTTDDDFWADSNLAQQVEQVRFTPFSLSLEELSKLWSVFFQVPYDLSVAYQASVVLIESDEVSPKPALPIRERRLHVMPFRRPLIEAVSPTHVVVGEPLTITGQNLKADRVTVTMGKMNIQVVEIIDDGRLEVKVQDNKLRAGINSLQVRHDLDLGTDAEPHRGFESNVVPFVLRPMITKSEVKAGSQPPEVTVSLAPKVGKKQGVYLLLNLKVEEVQVNQDTARAYTLAAPRNNGVAEGQAATDQITFDLAGVETGEYFVRVRVDGAESALQEEGGRFTGPTVEIK